MFIRTWRLIALLLASLSLTMESAHVLELPQKLAYDAQMYAAVNGSLYKYFASVGGVYQIGAITAAFLLALALRGRQPAFAWTLAGALVLLAAFLVWLAVVEPVNREVAAALRLHPHMVPAVWSELRNRWEYEHAAGFAVQLTARAVRAPHVHRSRNAATRGAVCALRRGVLSALQTALQFPPIRGRARPRVACKCLFHWPVV